MDKVFSEMLDKISSGMCQEVYIKFKTQLDKLEWAISVEQKEYQNEQP